MNDTLPRPGEIVKALTLYQPWASLVAIGAKGMETRDWWTHHRGWLAIHAGKKFTATLRSICLERPFLATLSASDFLLGNRIDQRGNVQLDHRLPLGKVVALVRIVNCLPTESLPVQRLLARDAREVHFGNYGPGRFAHLYDRIVPLRVPLETNGFMGLWNWPVPDEIEYESAIDLQEVRDAAPQPSLTR